MRLAGEVRRIGCLGLITVSVEEDLKQNAVVLATFLYHAAMRDEKIPRN